MHALKQNLGLYSCLPGAGTIPLVNLRNLGFATDDLAEVTPLFPV